MDNSQCVVLVPVAKTLEPETEACLSELMNRGYPVRLLRNGSQVDLVRSLMATRAFRDGFAETFWIDSDIAFDPNDVEKIRQHGKPMTAGLYVKKGRTEFAAKFKEADTLTFGEGGGLLEMEYVGMGFTHIRKEVYEALVKDLPLCGGGYDGEEVIPFFLPMVTREGGKPNYLSEDYSFCRRAKDAGFTMFADTSIKLGHMGSYKYTWDDLVPKQNLTALQLGIDSNKQRKKAMTESQMYEKIGRLQSALEEENARYNQTLGLFAGVLSGDIAPERVMIDLTNRIWTCAALGQSPPMPATVNGIPHCIIGKATEPAEKAAE